MKKLKHGELEYLGPDETSLRYATSVILLPCPFCGAPAGPPIEAINRKPLFGDKPLYRSTIACMSNRCGATVGVNDYTRDDARSQTIALWQDRRPARERYTTEEMAKHPHRTY